MLSSGVLVLPGLAAQIAGPASLVACVLLSVASYPSAYTFASMSARNPASGGAYAFARESFGRPVATVTGWLFALWFVTGAPAATLIAASYIAYAFPPTRPEVYLTAGTIIVAAYAVNIRGIVIRSRVQEGVVVAIDTLLIAAVTLSIGSVRAENFSPFLPGGLSRVMYAVARDGGLPRGLAHLNGRTGVPDRSLSLLTGISVVMLAGYYVCNVDLETALLIPSGAAIIVYVIGSAAGTRLLRTGSWRRVLPWISLVMSLSVLPFVGIWAAAAILTCIAALVYLRCSPRRP